MYAKQPTQGVKSTAVEYRPAPLGGDMSSWTSLTAAFFGLGGLGVVGLTRLLSEVLQWHFARIATTETRGIAQRRATVRSMVRAERSVRTASSQDAAVNLVMALLETSEVLRVTHLIRTYAKDTLLLQFSLFVTTCNEYVRSLMSESIDMENEISLYKSRT